MALTPGTRLGAYDITAAIGEGGMGQVFRARDTTLHSDVALKVLPDSVAGDPERLARLTREAQTLASLNHPHIAAIYGLEEHGGVRALIMELVEGEDLSQRIARGAIPIDEALPIAKQIAEALEAAHEQGIIHRDLKPANVKVRPDGTVKVLDFGLANATDPTASSTASATLSPTLSMHATQAGVILGTAAYMSPEQAAGKAVDKRSDVWAFGVVLLEMLTGRQVFDGETISHVLAAVLTKDPDWTTLPANTPAPIRRLLRRCLERDRKRRLESAADARLEIDDALAGSPGDANLTNLAVATPAANHKIRLLPWAIAAMCVAVAGVLIPIAVAYRRESPVVPRPARFAIELPENTAFPPANVASVSVSPDGRHLAFIAQSGGENRLWLRPLEELTARALAGADGIAGRTLIWSPDSRSIAFVAARRLKKIDVAGGAPQTIADLPTAVFVIGGTWSGAGTILLGTNSLSTGILSVPASGGRVVDLTRPSPGDTESRHWYPRFLADGRRFVFSKSAGDPQTNGLWVGSLDSKDTSRAMTDAGQVQIVGQFLLFTRERSLFAQPFDARLVRPAGDPVQIADEVQTDNAGAAAYSASDDGVLVLHSGRQPTTQFTWLSRNGQIAGAAGTPGSHATMSMSPDQGRLVFGRKDVDGFNQNLWVTDLRRNVTTRLTFGANRDSDGAWSPDASRIAYASIQQGIKSLYEVPSSGGAERLLLKSDGPQLSMDAWSPDGRYILYHADSTREMRALPLEGDRKSMLVVRPPLGQADEPAFSRDGKWLAYNSPESGRSEVYVIPFPPTGARWQVSANGGGQPRWRGDGREFFCFAPDGTMMAVDIKAGAAIEPGTAHALFKTDVPVSFTVDQYAVSADGQRFLIMKPVGETRATPMTAILDWPALLEK